MSDRRNRQHCLTLRLSLFYTVAMGLSLIAHAEATDDWHVPARAAHRKNPIPADSASISTGHGLYVKQCLSCHGEGGRGDGAMSNDLSCRPPDLSDGAVASQTDGALFYKIATGRKPMPAFEKLISEGDRWHVVNYIRSLNTSPTTAPAGG